MTSAPRTVVARVPGSKSVMARALVIAALAEGTTRLVAPLVAADTVAFAEGMRSLGFPVIREPDVWSVTGDPAGPPATEATVWCHDSGTAARFVPALAALGSGRYVIDASAQMRARPMGSLLTAMRGLDVRVDAAVGGGLPWVVHGSGVAGGAIEVDAGASSQYLSALCLSAPAMRHGLTVRAPNPVSAPYVHLTLTMMRQFGVESSWQDSTITVPPGTYQAQEYQIEPDASTASYFFAAAAVTGNTVTVPGLGRRSSQGDLRFATEVLPTMGCRVEVGDNSVTVTGPTRLRSPGTVAMRDISDTMMTLAAIAPFADAPTRITDVANCRLKESDRIDAITTALTACGVSTRSGPDWLEIDPGVPTGALVRTRSDHRIAMSMSVTGLRTPAIEFDEPSCVDKTFPQFHEEFAALARGWGLPLDERRNSV
ncbi:3-phosphoshikimate 1-carboxyvinyltransferase [Micromonospora ureilytica]|uniref:3-phosphoshikimate 1-carboxyvinyltransferase n=1 Tax=Micromonospora ureilytica TaxID=709868 RepID=A0A3N9Y7B2_9ACTN|nr:3-phosphoshikimate 1-carboxyvinyltransferase [Micromonospora ureilytica]